MFWGFIIIEVFALLSLRMPNADDISAKAVVRDAPAVAPSLERAPVAMSWPIEQDLHERGLANRPTPHHAESRAYWQVESKNAFSLGIPVVVSDPGALVKISPIDGTGVASEQFEVVTPGGNRYRGAQELTGISGKRWSSNEVRSLALDSSLVALRPELGVGKFTARGKSEGEVLVYVLEPESQVRLTLTMDKDVVFVGEKILFATSLLDGQQRATVTQIEGEVQTPAGERLPLRFSQERNGKYREKFVVPLRWQDSPGLYVVQADAKGHRADGVEVRRTVKNTFAVSVPSARFQGDTEVSISPHGTLSIGFAVEVGVASRFAVSAVLWGTTPEGELQPLAIGQAAQWMEPGDSRLALKFSPESITAKGIGAPYELRDLRLHDQGRLMLLHRQAQALWIPEIPLLKKTPS